MSTLRTIRPGDKGVFVEADEPVMVVVDKVTHLTANGVVWVEGRACIAGEWSEAAGWHSFVSSFDEDEPFVIVTTEEV